MNCLFISGTPDDSKGTVHVGPKGRLFIMVQGSTNIFPNLNEFPGQKEMIYLEGQQGHQDLEFEFSPDVIFNEISDPDSHRRALNRCARLCDQQGLPVINDPRTVLMTRRDQIATRLASIPGLDMPVTVRFEPRSPQEVKSTCETAGIEFPAIFRQAGDHGGISTVLLHGFDEIEAKMYQYPLDGRPYYLTQFVNYQSADKLYRKYRIVVVSGIPLLRHMIVSDSWLIHSASREFMDKNPQYKEEEMALLESFNAELGVRLAPCVNAIYSVLQLDYFGIDCTITPAGNMLAFEINANMNILINSYPSPNIWDKPIAEIKQHLVQLIVRRSKR